MEFVSESVFESMFESVFVSVKLWYHFLPKKKWQILSNLVNTAIWNQERFEGILRSFQIDGIPQYPTYTPETSKCVQRISYDGK